MYHEDECGLQTLVHKVGLLMTTALLDIYDKCNFSIHFWQKVTVVDRMQYMMMCKHLSS